MRNFAIVLLVINTFKLLYKGWIEDTLQLDAIANVIFISLYLVGV